MHTNRALVQQLRYLLGQCEEFMQERCIIHLTSVIFPEFQQLPIKNTKKGDLDFILNQIKLKLGEEETETSAQNGHKIIDELDMVEDRRLLVNIKKQLAEAESHLWKEAAKYKMEKFSKLGIWEAVKLFLEVKTLGYRWVFEIKPGANNKTEKF